MAQIKVKKIVDKNIVNLTKQKKQKTKMVPEERIHNRPIALHTHTCTPEINIYLKEL